jgi:hypothetical protein
VLKSSLSLVIPTEVPTHLRKPGSPTACAKARLTPARLAATHPVAVGERFDTKAAALPKERRRLCFEQALKFAILGRKAWLFFGNPQGGHTAATLFTLTKSCNRHRIDPFAYLQDVYTRLPTMAESELDCLLPDRWLQEHPEHLIEPRLHEAQQRAQRTRARRAERRRLTSPQRQA